MDEMDDESATDMEDGEGTFQAATTATEFSCQTYPGVMKAAETLVDGVMDSLEEFVEDHNWYRFLTGGYESMGLVDDDGTVNITTYSDNDNDIDNGSEEGTHILEDESLLSSPTVASFNEVEIDGEEKSQAMAEQVEPHETPLIDDKLTEEKPIVTDGGMQLSHPHCITEVDVVDDGSMHVGLELTKIPVADTFTTMSLDSTNTELDQHREPKNVITQETCEIVCAERHQTTPAKETLFSGGESRTSDSIMQGVSAAFHRKTDSKQSTHSDIKHSNSKHNPKTCESGIFGTIDETVESTGQEMTLSQINFSGFSLVDVGGSGSNEEVKEKKEHSDSVTVNTAESTRDGHGDDQADIYGSIEVVGEKLRRKAFFKIPFEIPRDSRRASKSNTSSTKSLSIGRRRLFSTNFTSSVIKLLEKMFFSRRRVKQTVLSRTKVIVTRE